MSTFLQNIHVKFRSMCNYFATIRPLVQLLWRVSPLFFLTSFGLTLLSGLLPLASILITSMLIQTLVESLSAKHSASILVSRLILLLVFMVSTHLLMQLSQRLNIALSTLHRTRIINHVQLLIAQKAAEIDLACFENPEFHNRIRTAANETAFRIPMFLDRLMMIGSTLMTFISLAVILLLWHAWIVLAIVLSSLVTLWISTHFSTARVNLVAQRAETERKKFYLNSLFISEMAAKEMRLFGLQDFLLMRFRRLLETTYQQDRHLVLHELLYSSVAVLLLSLVQPMLIAFTAFQTLQGVISIGLFSLYTQSILQLESGWTQLMVIQSGLHESNLFAAHLFDFLAIQPQVEARRPQASAQSAVISQLPRIEFRGVSFNYPGTEHVVLKDVSFVIQPGEAIALVGDNGAGKSTLVKLLAGLYTPTKGHIFLDSVDIQTLDRSDLRAHLSVIFQDYIVYHFSARENIGVGQIDWLDDSTRIEEAANRSGLDHVIAQLPDGYETVLGRFWEKGHELSGGQRQLVALTRALLRDGPVLILDEPSAALDIYAEQRFFQQLLEGWTSGRRQTVIFISHRFTTVRRADRVLVLEHGCLTEQGTHEQLMAHDGHYAEMFNLQVAAYNSSQLGSKATKKPELTDIL